MSKTTLNLSAEKISEIRGWIKQVKLYPILKEVGIERHQFNSIISGRNSSNMLLYTQTAAVIEKVKAQIDLKESAISKINAL